LLHLPYFHHLPASTEQPENFTELKRIFYLSICLTLGFTFPVAICQTHDLHVSFSSNFGGSDKEEFFGGDACSDGGFVLAGLSPSIDFDISQPAYDSANVFIVKCDSNGDKIWSRTYGGNSYDKARYIFEDSNGDLIFIGGTQSSDGDINYNRGNSDLMVAKLNQDGDIKWLKTYGGSDYEGGRYITETSDGGYIFCGYSSSDDFDVASGGRGKHDGWLTKLDIDGNIVWTNTFGGDWIDRIRWCVELPDHGYIFAGQTGSDTLDCTGNHGNSDVWAGRVDSQGNLMWSKQFGGSGTERAYHISKTTTGTFIITGQTNSNDFDVSENNGGFDGWILELDIDGNLIWEHAVGGSNNEHLFRTYETSDGGLISAGSSASDDHDVLDLECKAGDSFLLMKHDNFRKLEWAKCSGGSKSDVCNELIVLENDEYVLMGDSKSDDGDVKLNYGEYDYWIVKLAPPTPIDTITPSLNFTAFYDQNTKTLVIESFVEQTVYISITTMDGKIVTTKRPVQISPGTNQSPLNISSLTSLGIYHVVLEGTESNYTLRIPVLK